MRERRTIRPQLVLEMTMRDVLGNMEEMVSEYGFYEMDGEFEIIAIERAEQREALFAESPTPNIRELFSAQIHSLSRTAAQVA